ncbi:hypothetical protein ING2D1G_0377 [Peptoniphilus sp. ING2-D1G]|nr:hypothetical protein ING2D1G_0377 [Peptoniphilus sp. ING2-D1G]
MKFFSSIADLIIKIFRALVVLLIIAALGLIIKWKADTLYLQSISDTEIKFSLVDEIKRTKDEILNFGKEETVKKDSDLEVIHQNYITVNIPGKASIDEIADILLDKKLMTSKEAFKQLVYDMGLEKKFVAGTYEIAGGTKIKDTILKLTGTETKLYGIEITEKDEGTTVAKKLEDMGAIQSAPTFIQQVSDLKLYYSFVPGEYEFETPIRVIKIIELLTGKKD